MSSSRTSNTSGAMPMQTALLSQRSRLTTTFMSVPFSSGTRRAEPSERSGRDAVARSRRGAAARVREQVDHRAAECGEVVGLAARHEVAVAMHLLVDPLAAGVADVGVQAGPRRQRP